MWNPVFSVPLVHGTSPGRWSCLPLTDRDFSAALPVHRAEAEALSFKPQIPPALGPPALGAGLSSPDLEPG